MLTEEERQFLQNSNQMYLSVASQSRQNDLFKKIMLHKFISENNESEEDQEMNEK